MFSRLYTVKMKISIVIGSLLACTIATPGSDTGSAILFRDIENAIVDGFDASRHEFPYQISLQRNFFGSFEHVCGGSIISPKFVVTAGHCIDSYYTLRVVAGLLNMDELKHRDVQIVDVVGTYVHPDYESDTGASPNDIAVVKLAKRLQYTKAVKPILLPEAGSEHIGMVKLSGWGSRSDLLFWEDYPNRLQHASLYLLSYEACQGALNRTMGDSSPLTRAMVCTGTPFGTTSGCFGDSGGPIQQNNQLIGIASWVVRPCGTKGAPTMYTKTSYYVYFIKEIVDDL